MKILRFLALAGLLLTVVACGGGAATDAPADTQAPQPTSSPPPADTDVPEPTADLQATSDAEEAAALAELTASIAPDLELAGFSSAEGELAFSLTESFDTVNDVPSGFLLNELEPGFSAGNFVLGFDLTWDSTGALAYCGMIFRSQGNDITRGEQARFWTVRFSGLPYWDIEIWKFGQYQSQPVRSVDSVINQTAGSTNHYVIAANGTNIKVFGNGEKMGETELKQSMGQGQFGYVSWLDSGQVTCNYSNLWIWALP